MQIRMMGWIQDYLSTFRLPVRALIVTLAIMLVLAVVGVLMGWLRHAVIEGALARVLGAKAAIFIGYHVTILGTLHHELAHALGYLLTGGRVHKISILPKAQPDGTVRLGYVTSSTRGPLLLRAVQNTLGSTGPLYFGFLTIWLLWRFALPAAAGNVALTVFLWYAIVSIALHMELSRPDLKLLARGLFPSALLLYLIVLVILLISQG